MLVYVWLIFTKTVVTTLPLSHLTLTSFPLPNPSSGPSLGSLSLFVATRTCSSSTYNYLTILIILIKLLVQLHFWRFLLQVILKTKVILFLNYRGEWFYVHHVSNLYSSLLSRRRLYNLRRWTSPDYPPTNTCNTSSPLSKFNL